MRPGRSFEAGTELPERDPLIGLNGDAERVSDPVSHSKRAANNNRPLVYSFERLIDEVRIHDLICQGINSGSGWVTENNQWMADQSWEIGGPHGCAEYMADKRCRFNHVRLLENTDALDIHADG